MSLDLYQDEVRDMLSSMQPVQEPEAGAFTGFIKGTGMATMRGFAKMGRAIDMAGAIGPIAQDAITGGTAAQEKYFKEHDDVFNHAVDYWTPKPNEVGTAGEVVGGLLSALPAIIAAPELAVGSAGLDTAEDLARQGVSPTKAIAAGATQAAGLGLGIWMPILGQNGWQRIVIGGAGFNAAQGAATRGITSKILEDTPAEGQYKALDPTSVTLDVLLGAAFGSIAHLSPAQRQHGAEALGKLKDWAQSLKPSDVDALATLREAQHLNVDSAAGKLETPKDIEAHVTRMRTGLDQVLRDEPVEVSTLPQPKVVADHERFADAERRVTDLQAHAEELRNELGLPHPEEITARVDNIGERIPGQKYGVSPEQLMQNYGSDIRPMNMRDTARESVPPPVDSLSPPPGGSAGLGGTPMRGESHSLENVQQDWTNKGIDYVVSENGDTISVGKIAVPKALREQGVDTDAMRSLLDYADSTGKRIVLTPSSGFGDTKARLTEFYKRLGFVENKGKNKDSTTTERMIRQPQHVEAAPNSGRMPFQGGNPDEAARSQLHTDENLLTVGGGTAERGWSAATGIRGTDGQPAPVYRGAAIELAPEHFDIGSLGKSTGHPSSGLGVWFSAARDQAAQYGEVEKFHLDIRNPKEYAPDTFPAFDSVEDAHKFREQLQAEGYDGIVVDGRELGGPVNIVAFHPDQVILPDSGLMAHESAVGFEERSAETGSSGEAGNTAKPDILKSEADRIAADRGNEIISLGRDAEGNPITTTVRQYLDEARADAAVAREDAKLFEVAAGCYLARM